MLHIYIYHRRMEDFMPVTNGVISSSRLCFYGRFYASN